MAALYLISVSLHVLAAIVWIGGTVFFTLVLIPVSRLQAFQERASELVRVSGERFRVVSWVCLGILVVTGVANLGFRGYTWASVFTAAAWTGPFGKVMAHKLGLVALILLIGALHDFYVGPMAMAAWDSDSMAHRSLRLRRTASWMARVNLALALAVVVLGVMLARGQSW
jgi:uncharacterized membrane protein